MKVNLIIAAIVLACFAFAPRLFQLLYGLLAGMLRSLARRPVVALACAALFPVAIRLAMLPWLPIPEPRIHDEFSYLLAADTFAHGRVTNPTHPLWQFFETFHTLPMPTYMSKYPPMQGLFMAVGQVLFGHPWWGVVLSVALMCGVTCWMLRAWLPPCWALLGSFAVGLQFGVTHYWMNSYWGGAPAAIGAGLLMGGFGRLRGFRPGGGVNAINAALMALGVAVLLNSRPFEGFTAGVPIGVGLLAWLISGKITFTAKFKSVIVPCASILLLTVLGMAYYNWRITGNPLHMPYTVAHKTYSIVPLFVWQKATIPPPYHHAVMEKFYTQWETHYQSVDQLRTLRGWARIEPGRLRMTKDTLFGNFFLLLCCVCAPWWWRKPGMRILLFCLVTFSIGLALESWSQIHYFGVVLGAATALKAESLRKVNSWMPLGKPWGKACAAALVLCSAVTLASHLKPDPPGVFSGQRAHVRRLLEAQPGGHVVIVRYAPQHNPIQEWVFNGADIDGSKIIWARDMSAEEDRKLFEYFKGRRFWSLQPDVDPARLEPLSQ